MLIEIRQAQENKYGITFLIDKYKKSQIHESKRFKVVTKTWNGVQSFSHTGIISSGYLLCNIVTIVNNNVQHI